MKSQSIFHLLFPFFVLFLFKTCLITPGAIKAQDLLVSVKDSLIAEIHSDFYGIQYHERTYGDADALKKLQALHLQPVRLWAKLNEFHPQPNVWKWDDLDARINEVLAAGFDPMVCLYQSEQWFTGTADDPWWNDSLAISEWRKAARQLALRYENKVRRYIIFDEINMLHPEDGYYISFANSARLYCAAAEEIKKVDPALTCGGPSSFGGWENAHWAQYVLQEANGAQLLDFVSVNLFLSWNASDADSLLLNRTIWYEEAPLSLKAVLGEKTPPILVLDAYNVSALWQKDGQLWTDPRNTNYFGALYQALALLHAAKGGFDITLHWETLGGYGVLDWYPQFNPLPPYYAWRFIADIGGLQPGSQILSCCTSQPAKEKIQHLAGMNVETFTIQPFAIKQGDSVLSIILVNKGKNNNDTVHIKVPSGKSYFRLFRFDADHIETCFESLEQGRADSLLTIACPGQSVTVVKFYKYPLAISKRKIILPKTLKLVQVAPNPFNSHVRIEFKTRKQGRVHIQLFNSAGKKIVRLLSGTLGPGLHRVIWNGRDSKGIPAPTGVYFLSISQNHVRVQSKILLLR